MGPGGLAQMSHSQFNSVHGLAMPSSGLASRRGGQNIKPLSFEGMKVPTDNDTGVQTPRTSRGHLLAGLRTAPKSATVGSFSNGPASPTVHASQGRNRNSMQPGMYDNTSLYGAPKTSMPRFAGSQQQHVQQQQQQQQQPQQQQQAYNSGYGQSQQFTTEQILAPPQIQLDETTHEQLDPNLHAQLLYTNAYLSDQQQRLQQQLRVLQQAAQQFQGLNLNNQAPMMQQAYSNLYQQQLQSMMGPTTPQPNVYSVYDPMTGQQTLYMDPAQTQAQAQAQAQAQLSAQYAQAQLANAMHVAALQQQQAQQQQAQQQQQQQQQHYAGTPRVQVSPPPEANQNKFRSPTPPRRYESPLIENPTPLPPPSANAFRRGHKKTNSTSTGSKTSLTIATNEEPLKSAGLKTGSIPLTPLTSGYGPGQARAGEHPVRQPRHPPSLDELKAKPTSKHEGSKNFVTRTRRSAINNLMRAGLERRKEARNSGSISPISESTEEIQTPLSDNDSDSGHSGSGSLIERDDAASSLPSSRTSTGSWGAIGSDRPSSRQKTDRRSPDSATSSDNEGARDLTGSFASLLKKNSRAAKAESVEGQRKAAMLVLTSAEKRKVVA